MKKQPLKEKLKAIGGGHLLNESHAWERKFGEPLPTLDSVQQKKNKGKLKEGISKEKIDVEIVAKKMAKESKWFGPSWAKALRKKYKNGVSEYDLQMDLPDYIEGGAISGLFK